MAAIPFSAIHQPINPIPTNQTMNDKSPAPAGDTSIRPMDKPPDPEAAETAQTTGGPAVAARTACSRFLGEQDINAIVRGEVAVSPGDTFTAESSDRKGVSAYAYEPGCRQGQGEWNNFRLLAHGLRTTAIAAATSFANANALHQSDQSQPNESTKNDQTTKLPPSAGATYAGFFIVNDFDRPDEERIAERREDGKFYYIHPNLRNIKRYRGMTPTNPTPLEDFGIWMEIRDGKFRGKLVDPSQAAPMAGGRGVFVFIPEQPIIRPVGDDRRPTFGVSDGDLRRLTNPVGFYPRPTTNTNQNHTHATTSPPDHPKQPTAILFGVLADGALRENRPRNVVADV